MGSSGGQQPVTQQTTQTKDPWSGAQPQLLQGLAEASRLYNLGIGYNPYTGNTTAPFNPSITNALSGINALAGGADIYGTQNLAGARGLMSNLVGNEGLNAGLRTAAGQYGDIYSRALGNENPYLQGTINQQMNKVNSAVSGAGRYGSGMHDAAIAQAIAPTLAQDYMQRQQLQMQATGAMGDIYGQGLQRAGQAAQLIPSLDEARFANMGHLLDAGNIQRTYDQAQIDQALKLYNAQQARDWEQLNRYMAASGLAGGLGGTQITSSPGAQQPSTMQRVLGGAMAGGGMGSMFGPVGMGVGALGGGLLGMM